MENKMQIMAALMSIASMGADQVGYGSNYGYKKHEPKPHEFKAQKKRQAKRKQAEQNNRRMAKQRRRK